MSELATISVVILTYNEQIHIERCLRSASLLTDNIWVIDSFSTDKTLSLAEKYGARCMSRIFTSHSDQFNWALEQIDPCDWIVRLDADEFMSEELVKSILCTVNKVNHGFNGFTFKRRIRFLGNDVFYGGVFPVEVVRMFRYGSGRVESRLMDEHIIVNGNVGNLNGEIVDDNKNSLSWWIEKHNRYSSLEALEMFFADKSDSMHDGLQGATATRRKLKGVYQSMPLSIRASLLFLYRYFVRLGFLDGQYGFLFHFYQCYWYRLLVDSKYLCLKDEFQSVEFTTLRCSEILGIQEFLVKDKFSSNK
tara:strand:+ start:83 stop:1000 length:918 start_codon:yes stop_codon:yes gene_type:complete